MNRVATTFVGDTAGSWMTYPPKVKVTKLSQLRKTTLLLHEFTCIFSPYWLMNYSISWCILQENSIPRSMNGESCGYDLCGGHSIFLNDIPPKIKVTKLSRLGKEIIATRVYMHFFTHWIINYSISWCILQENSIPRPMRGESCCYDYFWWHSSLLNDIPPK